MIRIASFNVENLFARPKAFRFTDLSVAEPILAAYSEVNLLMRRAVYTDADKARMIELLVLLDVYFVNVQSAVRRRESLSPTWAWLRKNRGDFDLQPQDESQSIRIVADGRGDWIGWVELATEPTDETGTRMTARVIQDVGADVLGIVEAEDRPALVRFNQDLLGGLYGHAMLIDGNDERGIDVALLTRPGFAINPMRSNVDLHDDVGVVFSRDCPQYQVHTPLGATIHVLVNHFKSQSGGGGDKRRRQADSVRSIVDDLVAANQHVVVLGDLNEGPPAGGTQALNLERLYADNSPLVDCYSLAGFELGDRLGSYDSCGLGNRLDYVFLSLSLLPSYQGGGLFRTGLWGSRITRPDAWATYPEMTSSSHQASDHAAIYVDLEV